MRTEKQSLVIKLMLLVELVYLCQLLQNGVVRPQIDTRRLQTPVLEHNAARLNHPHS